MSPHQEQRRHFHVDAREMLLDVPEKCPVAPGITFDGLAVTPEGQHHLIVTARGQRAYVGPDVATVTRRAEILTQALSHGPAALDTDHATWVGWWVREMWEAVTDELTNAITSRWWRPTGSPGEVGA